MGENGPEETVGERDILKRMKENASEIVQTEELFNNPLPPPATKYSKPLSPPYPPLTAQVNSGILGKTVVFAVCKGEKCT